MSESRAVRLKRLKMQSWRRGMREMDLILGPFADDAIAFLPVAELDTFEALLAQNDQEIYAWITRAERAPSNFADLIEVITRSIRKRSPE